ncbi:MAG: diaminopimelate epimerase [Melioribacteraceae bacterium]|nr:diaminopimelate epimerase [Melioribacteraceae bacterium]
MTFTFLKVHGSGNTFYLHEELENTYYDWPQLAISLCDNSNENGADGILVVSKSIHAEYKMRVFNSDGSEASMCGNGLRCVARYVLDKSKASSALIETMKVDLMVQIESPIFNAIPTYSVQISPVSFELPSLNMNYHHQSTLMNQIVPEFAGDIHFTAVSIPNPHLIGIVPIQYIENLEHQEQLATYLNSQNPYFSDGVNVSYIHPVNETSIFVRTFERGVGFTNACGTAMSASALVATEIDLVPKGEVTVYNPGGFVKCLISKDQSNHDVTLIGNATIIGTYKGEYDMNHQFKWIGKTIHSVEVNDYQELTDYASKQIKENWS